MFTYYYIIYIIHYSNLNIAKSMSGEYYINYAYIDVKKILHSSQIILQGQNNNIKMMRIIHI